MSKNETPLLLPHEKQIADVISTIEHLKRQNKDSPLFTAEIKKLEQKLEKLKEKVYGELTAWERVLIARHPQRPRTVDYIKHITEQFVELHGDRLFADDPAIVGGLATIGGVRCMLIGQEKGNDTESRIARHFGMVNPEGFRKAMRLMKMAEKFHLPVVTLLDTTGANPALEAEERGQGWAIADNLLKMARLQTPILVLVIGEGCSGGALGIGVGDVVAMLQHSYYSVISPEGCASILWKDHNKKQEAAATLKQNAEDLLKLKLIDDSIQEPLGGAHHNPSQVYASVKQYILDKLALLQMIPPHLLLEQRYQKFRAMGEYQSK
ncbi:MAG TPA: acetyl-CoA carboxylase carboxyltransferase subunit alpha [Chlamydiales bacterium]|nr:acetyl-CoA carboxylase carboxyltransferase subunit alpha [Chlamydiales bacterium]